MSRNRKLVKVIRKIYHNIYSFYALLRKQFFWLLRTFLISRSRPRSKNSNAGFVLPTVAMVSLVVVLLTVAILFRSFERSKNASNVRVNEATLAAATPAIDRAKAKINKLFEPGSGLPRATPTDTGIENLLNNKVNEYTFGDETNLSLSNGTQNIRTAWRYPVDTDNNGRFDSYVLYGIYFKNPDVANGQYTSTRNPLQARTPPMVAGTVSASCKDILGTSATLVGSTGWSNIGGKLKKSFYVYTTTVPITKKLTGANSDSYETYKGNKGFSAIEYQQDRVQLPLVNNAVVYEDDIALTPGTNFNLNGRIITNSNFITGGAGSNDIKLYQVSSKDSCFYEAENAKIIVGGNLGGGGFRDSSDLRTTSVDLFKGKGQNVGSGKVNDNKSVTNPPNLIAYNNLAYVQRLNALVAAQIVANPTNYSADPQEVKDGIESDKKKSVDNGATPTQDDIDNFRQKQLRAYFQRRTRRVPYAEVDFGETQVLTNPIQGSGDTLRPKDEWIYPTDPTDGITATNYTDLTLYGGNKKYLPSATEPAKLNKNADGKENYVGDRILLGNNLPELWWNKSKNKFFGPDDLDTQELSNSEWDDGSGKRTRRTRIEQLADLGKIERDGDWEQAAAKVPDNPQDPVGGLRVVTGAGIYLPSPLTLSSTAVDFNASKAAIIAVNPDLENKIWSDMMPVPSSNVKFAPNSKLVGATAGTPGTAGTLTALTAAEKMLIEDNTPYLRMRATAVYHYKSTGYDQKDPKPIACVSSYYDPTNSQTARNQDTLPDVSQRSTNRDLTGLPTVSVNPGNSNNGVVYAPPTKTETNYQAILDYQKNLRYSNGRLVNQALKNALETAVASRTLADKSAIDAAICSLQILDKSITASDAVIPHGAIRETAFLDGRQIKAIHADNSATTGILETFTNADGGAVVKDDDAAFGIHYDLPIEQRQPLEIRTTVIDVDLLRRKQIGGATGGQEYLVPNSGIIYATREDALLDLSATIPAVGSNAQKYEEQKQTSRVDFKLDPTRRPNAIMLVNGNKLWREQDFRDVEKGFILASNLPVYIKGNFNLHTQDEFKTALLDNFSNFYSRAASQLNVNFACRKGDKRLPECKDGDEWRPASVLSDAVNLLSGNYREGFRNEGDYDLNNNLGDQVSVEDLKKYGFLNNAYATNVEWYDTTGSNAGYPKDLDPTKPDLQGSSYINTFVAPVQRRAPTGGFNEYLMEVCLKLPVSACKYDDWKIDPTKGSDKSNSWNFDDNPNGIIGQALSKVKSGTTAQAADLAYQNFPRRVAFKRNNSDGTLVLDGNRPRPLGIDPSGNIQEYPYTSTTFPRKAPLGNPLWFKTTTNRTTPTKNNDTNNDPGDSYLVLESINNLTAGTTDNPIPVPVLQFRTPFGSPDGPDNTNMGPPNNKSPNINTAQWLQVATPTTFNLAATGGDTPARPTEDNGGLHNFVRFLEGWAPTGGSGSEVKAQINGSFIQTGRSAYATGPFSPSLADSAYRIANGNGRLPFYLAPKRQWGYDVGLLSQAPDLFAQKLVRIPDDLPDEFFREVGRDDDWVKTLLCAKTVDANTTGANPTPIDNAVDSDQRPKCD